LLCVATDRELNKIKYLKSKGISIQSTDAYGRNAFYYACQVVDRDILQYLVAEGVKPTNDAFYALAKSSFQIIEPIKKYEFLVETFKLKPNAQSANEDLPLIHLLCQKDNYVSIISYLMDQGLKVDVKDDKGRTALWYAVQGNSLDVVELLWSHINVLDDMSNQEISVFEMALLNGTSDVVKFLISKGFNVTTKDANGSNYAHKLVQYAGMQTISRPNINKYEDIASKLTLLSEHGLSLKDVNADGNNILALAVLQNDFRLLAALSGMDVNPNQRNNEGLAPMHLAVRQSNAKQLIQYLLTIGADKKMTTPSGQTMVDLLKQHPTLKDDTSFFEQFLKED
jgi:ankyrin repeat protein